MNLSQKTSVVWFCVGVFFANFFLRSAHIRTTPFSLTWDEVYYVAQAKSIALSGTDLSRQWSVFRFTPVHSMYDEWTSLAIVPGFLLFPNDPLMAAKFVPILLGSLLPLLLGALVYRLSGQRSLFVIAALLSSVNPWIFQFSRMTYDSFYSLFAYTLALVLLLSKRKSLQLLSLPWWVFGFFQYQGHKVLLPVLIFIVIVVRALQEKEALIKQGWVLSIRPLGIQVLFFFLSCVLLFTYVQATKAATSNTRLNEVLFLNNEWQSETVNNIRRVSIPSVIEMVFSNKFTIQLHSVVRQYFEAYDLRQLFAIQDRIINTFMVWDYGVLHIADLGLFLVGLGYVVNKKTQWSAKAFFILMLLLSPLPLLIKTPVGVSWITFRCVFGFLTILLIAAYGAHDLLVRRRKLFLILMGLYLINVGTFFYQYFFRYPITSFQNLFFTDRIISNYILRASDMQITYSGEGNFFWYSVLTFNPWMTKNSIAEVQDVFSSYQGNEKNYLQYKNLRIFGSCLNPAEATGSATLITQDAVPCVGMTMPREVALQGIAIGSPADPGTPMNIFNDRLCTKYNLGTFVQVRERRQLDIEKLSDQEFCETYFVRKNFINLGSPPEKM